MQPAVRTLDLRPIKPGSVALRAHSIAGSASSGPSACSTSRSKHHKALVLPPGNAVLAGAFSGLNRRAVAKLRQRLSDPYGVSAVQAPEAPVSSDASAMTVVNVDLGDRSYPIYIGAGLLAQPELLRQHIPGSSVLVVTNTTVAPLFLEQLEANLRADGTLRVEHVVLPDGEEHKSMEVVARVWDAALAARLDRNSTFVALGGGVVGDMTGFAAACYQRGVHFVQVPTTVMAQVDSSVGGKTGVNLAGGKNMVGAFHQPRAVLVDTATLATLPARELASGLSEVVKYGLIRDAPLFEWLEANVQRLLDRDPAAIAYAVERSCINKAEVVAADERESGLRATLNLGHTFGHAMETATGYGTWLHGEAVAAGMVMAADLSVRLGWIERDILDRTRALLERAGLPVVPPAGMTAAQFRELMAVDKKVSAGRLRLILLRGALGGCVFTADFDHAKLEETLAHFCAQ